MISNLINWSGNWEWEKSYAVTDVAVVVLVVGHELRGALDVAVVDFVVEQSIYRHHHWFLHLVRNHHPHYLLHRISLFPLFGCRENEGKEKESLNKRRKRKLKRGNGVSRRVLGFGWERSRWRCFWYFSFQLNWFWAFIPV